MKNKKRQYSLFIFGGLLVIVVSVLLLRTYHRTLFQKTATGLQYQVASRGKGPSPQSGDIVLFHVRYKTGKGDVLFDTTDQELPMALPYSQDDSKKDGGLLEAFSLLQKKGDQLVCKLDGKMLEYVIDQYGLKQNEKIFLHLQLQDIMPEEAYQKWEKEQITMLQRKHQEKAEQQLMEDKKAIIRYLEESGISAQATSSGLYYVIDTPGKGIQPKQGSRVSVDYTGRLLDGKVFDTSLVDVAKKHGIYNPQRTYEAIEFQVGVGQVIPGWDEGIMRLQQGAKGRLFIPSTLAYGSRGAGNGLIPAHATLIFEVTLLDVQD